MRITVFASSSPRTPPAYCALAAQLGTLIAAAGHELINGAGREGCMGALNEACLAAGGRVHGVILRCFHEAGLTHAGLRDVVIADTMRERKRLLGDTADAYIVLPGGPGTWEEFWEVAVERQIAVHVRPLVVVNADGFYAGFLAQVERAWADGLLYGPAAALFTVVADPAAAVTACAPDQSAQVL